MSDSSGTGYAMHYTDVTQKEIESILNVGERWRFKDERQFWHWEGVPCGPMPRLTETAAFISVTDGLPS